MFTINHNLYRVIVLNIILSSFLFGCGGSKSGASDPVVGDGNTKPTAFARVIRLEQNISTDLQLGGTDDENDVLSIIIVEPPKNGRYVNNLYIPNADFFGTDKLVYKVSDGKLDSDPVEVNLTVIDVTHPVIQISNAGSQKITEITTDALFNIVISEDVSELKVKQISVTGGIVKNLTGSNKRYHLVISANKNSNIPIRVKINQNAVNDASDNGNLASNLSSREVDTQRAFITVWKTNNPGKSNSNQILIKGLGSGYNFRIDWGDGNFKNTTENTVQHTYAIPGIYTVKIKGDYPRIVLGGLKLETDALKLIEIKQWGTIPWQSMKDAFAGCESMIGDFIDKPDLTQVSDMSNMFNNASRFNSDVNNWDVSNVSNMEGLFNSAKFFNKPLDSWNTSKVKSMTMMFDNAEQFNSSVSSWDTSKVTTFVRMFNRAKKFNGSIAAWDISGATNMAYMFSDAISFNQDLSLWNTSKITSMEGMFKNSISFNGDITAWDLSSVVSAKFMFQGAENFNQMIAVWNVRSIKSMLDMFNGATNFNQDLSAWYISSVEVMGDMFFRTAMSKANIIKLKALWPLLETTVPN